MLGLKELEMDSGESSLAIMQGSDRPEKSGQNQNSGHLAKRSEFDPNFRTRPEKDENLSCKAVFFL